MCVNTILKDHKPLIQMEISYDKLRKGEFYIVSELGRWDIRICQLNGEDACYPSECCIVKENIIPVLGINIIPVLGIPDSPKALVDGDKLVGKKFKAIDTGVIYEIVSETDDPRLMMMIGENAASFDSPEIVTKYWLSKFAISYRI